MPVSSHQDPQALLTLLSSFPLQLRHFCPTLLSKAVNVNQGLKKMQPYLHTLLYGEMHKQ